MGFKPILLVSQSFIFRTSVARVVYWLHRIGLTDDYRLQGVALSLRKKASSVLSWELSLQARFSTV